MELVTEDPLDPLDMSLGLSKVKALLCQSLKLVTVNVSSESRYYTSLCHISKTPKNRPE